MKIKYIDKRFHKRSTDIIAMANLIIEEYQEKGFDLTLRQLYYQFVARDLIPNKQKEYDKLGNIISTVDLLDSLIGTRLLIGHEESEKILIGKNLLI